MVVLVLSTIWRRIVLACDDFWTGLYNTGEECPCPVREDCPCWRIVVDRFVQYGGNCPCPVGKPIVLAYGQMWTGLYKTEDCTAEDFLARPGFPYGAKISLRGQDFLTGPRLPCGRAARVRALSRDGRLLRVYSAIPGHVGIQLR